MNWKFVLSIMAGYSITWYIIATALVAKAIGAGLSPDDIRMGVMWAIIFAPFTCFFGWIYYEDHKKKW